MNSAADTQRHLLGHEPAGTPPYETERLAALRNLGLLDTEPGEAFDQVTRLAAKALRIPMVLVSLVDEHRQWFKSRVGLEIAQTSRSVSFCAHVLLSLRPLIVRDTTLDARFAGNPLVTGAPHIRAYAGIPLFTGEGHAIGTLCALDHAPREFVEAEMDTLRDCASLVQGFIYAHELAARNQSALQGARERETPFRETFERAAVGIIHSSPAGQLLRVNRQMCRMLGYTAVELQALSYVDISHPEDLETAGELLQNIASGSLDSYGIETRYLRSDGGFLWTFASMAVKRSASGAPEYFIAVIEDISSRKQLETELGRMRGLLAQTIEEKTLKLQESNVALRTHVKKLLESERRVQLAERRLRAIADCMPVTMGYWTRELVCEFANEGYRTVFALAPEQMVGKTLSDLLGPERFAAVEPHARRALAGHNQRFERATRRADGVECYLEAHFRPDRDEFGNVNGFFALSTDITTSHNVQVALEAANAKLSNSGIADYLTGIANRGHVTVRGTEAALQFAAGGDPYGLILVDLDGFKRVNDTHGHEVGDDVLRRVAGLLKAQLRNHRDVAARLGGGRFVMLCFGDLDEELLSLVAEALRAQIETARFDHGSRLTASLGVALCQPEDAGFDGIYSRAQKALEEAHSAGSNRVILSRHRAA